MTTVSDVGHPQWDAPENIGYHTQVIPKGELGELSKLKEELLEFEDALAQQAKVMALCELADLIGAIEAWLEKHASFVTLQDLIKMKDLTKRAFQSGRR